MSSSFKKRLKRLHDSRARRDAARQQTPEEPRVFTAEGVDAPSDDASESPAVVEKWRAVGAKSRSSGRGRADYLVRSHRQGQRHGARRLVEGTQVDWTTVQNALADSRIHTLHPTDIAFVDLETNGLAKSCFPFCIGIGVWEGNSFGVYHFFMPTDKDEAAALAASAELLSNYKGLCTFNGSSFDLPMLRRRFAHHDIDHNLDELPHVDLLRISRKILPERDSHKLSALEKDVLGFQRHDDIPGAKIPGRWNRYLKDQDPQLLLDVFKHNRFDILSMVVLLAEFAGATGFSQPDQPPVPDHPGLDQKQKRPRSKVGSKLARTYRLRDKSDKQKADKKQSRAQQKDRDTPDERPERVQLAASLSRSQLRKGMPVGTRLRELRGQVERLLEEQRWDESVDILHEMIALSPRHPWALEHLVEQHRRTGNTGLAEHYAKRLGDTAPY
ncbi:MAG: ribonuclease H-like domain-containing protein [Persicimonas sp.]